MKIALLGVLLASMPALALAEEAARAAPAPKTVEDFEQAYAALEQDFAQHVGAVEAAVREGARAGVLKVATEVYYLDELLPFTGWYLNLEPPNAHVPPLFDTSPPMQEINTAWAGLEAAQIKLTLDCNRLAREAEEAARDALEAALAKAENPEEMEPVRRLFSYTPGLSGAYRSSLDGQGGSRAYLVPLVEEALRARQTGDVRRLARALQAMGLGSERYQSPILSQRRNANPDPGVGLFKNRLLDGFRKPLRAEQTALETALMENRPLAEIDPIYARFMARLTDFQELEPSTLSMNVPQKSSPEAGILTRSYVAAAAIYQEMLAQLVAPGGERGKAAAPAQLGPEQEFAKGEEFRAFVRDFRAAAAPAREKAKAQPVAGAPEPPGEASSILEAKRHELAALRTPAQLTAFLEPLQDRTADLETRRAPADAQPLLRLNELVAALQELAIRWRNGEVPNSPEGGARPPGLVPGFFELRDWVRRVQAAEALALPELLEKPLVDRPLTTGLLEKANLAAQKGDWKRASDLLSAAGAASGQPLPQAGAVQAYLAGQQWEQAEIYPLAISLYESVLPVTAEPAPVAESTARLKALRAGHPELFQSRSPQPPVSSGDGAR